MKILIVNTADIKGGAARAAFRLHTALLNNGVDCELLVQSQQSDNHKVIGPGSNLSKVVAVLGSKLDAVPLRKYPNKSKALFSPSWFPFNQIANKINKINPDIVHLHWICRGMIRVEELSKIKAPIVWSLHDMWPFTGGCHYDEECKGYLNSCGQCKVLSSNVNNDLSRKGLKRKQATYSDIENLTIVGLSRWLANAASSSTLFKTKNVVNLPNPIDTNSFSPYNKKSARELFKLPMDKKLVLFGAMNSTGDARKGFKELKEALTELSDKSVELVVYGSSEPKTPQGLPQKVHYLGQLHDDTSLRALYNAADVMVVPSLQENLSNVIIESLACGTPVVAFNIGGNGDMIEHKHNGYLASPLDTVDLAAGISWVLENTEAGALSSNAREKVLQEFESSLVARKYSDLYSQILKN